jgi:hypothetical protein
MTDPLEKYMATGHLDDQDIRNLLKENLELRLLAARMHVLVEVWPVAADEQGIYALNPEAPRSWPTEPIFPSDDPDPKERKKAIHRAAEKELDLRGMGDRHCLHSTSWRAEWDALVVHYLGIVRCPDWTAGSVRSTWPDARPFSPNLPLRVGQPRQHGATAPPEEVRYIDILRHGIRHYRFLGDMASLGYNEQIGKALPEVWHQQLANVTPAIAQMFGPVTEAA